VLLALIAISGVVTGEIHYVDGGYNIIGVPELVED
jgi:enoyl-[acyl-carrier-protein] reductase (NADH)